MVSLGFNLGFSQRFSISFTKSVFVKGLVGKNADGGLYFIMLLTRYGISIRSLVILLASLRV